MLPHKSSTKRKAYQLKGFKALIITTSNATLDQVDDSTGEVLKKGRPTGVYASEMTEPYYVFQDAQMQVSLASIKGGKIPIEKRSLLPIVRTKEDSRYLKDPIFKELANNSIPISEVNIQEFDIVFLAGGWGAAYDLAQSDVLSNKITEAYAAKKILGAVCHGPLGFIGANKPDGSPLVENVKMTAVSNRQIKLLMVGGTPKHPETELRKANALFESNQGMIDLFNNHVVIDKKHLIVTGQNQKGGVEAAQAALELLMSQIENK